MSLIQNSWHTPLNKVVKILILLFMIIEHTVPVKFTTESISYKKLYKNWYLGSVEKIF